MEDINLISIEMINILYNDRNYKEALRGLILLKAEKPYGDNNKFNKLIDNLIECCIKKLKKDDLFFV